MAKGLTLKQQLDAKSRDDESGCRIWTAGKASGYGVQWVDGKSERVHRLAYALIHGSIPHGMEVCHRCDVRACLNPNHLFLGTHADNMGDMRDKGRARPPRGMANGKSKLSPEAVVAIRADARTGVELARLYGVTPQSIWQVRHRKSWAHLESSNG